MNTTPSTYRWLILQSQRARSSLYANLVVGVIIGLLIITQAALLSYLIDRIYLHHATATQLSHALLLLLTVIISRAILTGLRENIAFKTAAIVKTRLRQALCEQLFRLSPVQLARYKTGALTTTLLEQIEALQGFFSDYLPQITIAVILPLTIIIIVFFQNWLTGLILMITAPLIPIFMALIGMGVSTLNQRHFQSLARMSAHFLDTLQGLTTLVLFNRAHKETERIEKISEAYREKTMRILYVAFLSSGVLELFATLSIAIIAVYLGLGLLGYIQIGFSGVHLSLQHAFFILLLAPECFMPLRQLGAFYHARSEAIAAADEIRKVLNKTPEIMPVKNPIELHAEKISLSLKDIAFHYRVKCPIISQFSIEIPAGSCAVITGPSGAGKSTLLHLLAKFIIPTTGSIQVNHIHLNNIDTNHWHTHLALLTQNPRLFHGTIAENITLAKPNASLAEVEYAANAAGVLSFVHDLPQGLNTKIGEKNLVLSVGQAQRVALARIILKDAPLILLDEPTAYLDVENMKIVLRLLAQWKRKKTVIIATHDAASFDALTDIRIFL